jgi:hypothetical protein
VAAGVGGASSGGTTNNGGAGGALALAAGAGGNGTTTGGAGGSVSITAGNAGTGGNAAAGAITLTPGTATGTGKVGGIRNAASRNILANKPTAPVDIAGGITATVAQMLEAGIFLCSASATLTLPTMQGATGLVQALPGTPAVGDIIEFTQVVAAAQTATLAAGTGSTLAGIATTAAATTGRKWIGRVTSVTANSETVTWY